MEEKLHYYQFNIGDYQSHTAHLDESEDLAYRRMLDWCYLHEKPLPEDVGEVARLIRMRSHSDSIANVLREFFELIDGGWWSERVGREIQAIQSKSEKAKASAQARWNANAMRTHSDCNATQDPRPKTQDTKPKKIKAVVTATPDGVSNDVWESFLQVRKAKKAPVTTVAIAGIEKEAQKAGYTLEQALAMCCTRGWAGFKAAWVVEKQTESERTRDQMHQLTRGLATPKPQPFWAKTEPVEVIPNVEPKRLL